MCLTLEVVDITNFIYLLYIIMYFSLPSYFVIMFSLQSLAINVFLLRLWFKLCFVGLDEYCDVVFLFVSKYDYFIVISFN